MSELTTPVTTGQAARTVPNLPPPNPVPRPEDLRPADLWGQFPVPPLPVGLLPEVVEGFAVASSETMGADPSGVAMSALSVAAAALPDHVRLQPMRNSAWSEPARLWVMLSGLPSTMKSPIMDAAVRPLAKIDAQLVREWQRRTGEYEYLTKEEQRATLRPMQIRSRLVDTTVEALQEVLKGTTTGLLVHRDELSGWFGAMERYGSGGSGAADRAVWLSAYNGSEYAINRVGRGVVLIENLSVSILGGIQPDLIREIAGKAGEDGLLQRFLPIVLQPSALAKDVPVSAHQHYDPAIHMLRGRGPLCLHFDDAGHKVREAVMERHHRLQATESFNRKLAAHIGKLNGMFVRLCVVWHALENWSAPTLPSHVSGSTAQRVADFMRLFLLPHALSFYGDVLGLADEDERLKALAGYILAHRKSEIDHRTVQQSVHDMRKLKLRDTRPLFETLAALGWLNAQDDPTKRNGEPRWFVSPYVHTLFAERAHMEEARRHQARATLLELSGRQC